ncbi:MAG: ATP-binding protein [Flavobacteriaceae bacterium]|nr:ATP-binding protein [Flavobacteriaceae bacterium]MCY4297907.1 ATP-binding protein [Flavobacteriaceae bacterium]
MKHLKDLPYNDTPPNAATMINSFRSFGYDLKTAIADIIDNSISALAKNIWIDYQWKGGHSWVTITDDGYGMDGETLIEAMRPGSKNPIDERDEKDLGRFGLGLKTSSFSQCKCLTVITKKIGYNLIKRHWDLDYVNELGIWRIHDYLSEDHFTSRLQKLESGTTVIWEKMDRLVGRLNIKKENETTRKAFLEEFEDVENHLSLVFHRYIDRNKLNIWINDYKIKAWDPFMKEADGTQRIAEEKLDNKQIQIRCYVIPHSSKIRLEDREETRINQWYDLQGFYIYRNNRLLLYGDWLKLFPKKEYFKNARILIDIPNALDSQWKIDIKKAKATPPLNIRDDLKRLALLTRRSAANVHRFRDPITPNKDRGFQSLWHVIKNRDGIVQYRINSKHTLVETLLKSNQINKRDFKKVLHLVAQTIPIESIIQSYDEYHRESILLKELDPETIEIARELFDSMVFAGKTKERAVKDILCVEPFNKYPQLEKYLVS